MEILFVLVICGIGLAVFMYVEPKLYWYFKHKGDNKEALEFKPGCIGYVLIFGVIFLLGIIFVGFMRS
jgi:hypothetical protein